ncbi:RNA-binding protein [Chloroflexi bacterium CFX2]|jgi:cold-inducible RNA-binding protein|nr:RNA-binding protein [Chloroflexi bacterium CFX2]
MNIQLYVGNLSRRTTQNDLSNLFTRAGDVIEAELMIDRKSGISKGYAFVTMSAQSEADQAVNMFHRYVLDEYKLIVHLVKLRAQRGIKDPPYKP